MSREAMASGEAYHDRGSERLMESRAEEAHMQSLMSVLEEALQTTGGAGPSPRLDLGQAVFILHVPSNCLCPRYL